MTNAEAIALIDRLASLPSETEWVEWKLNHVAPDEFGEYVSALSFASRVEAGGDPLDRAPGGLGFPRHTALDLNFSTCSFSENKPATESIQRQPQPHTRKGLASFLDLF